MSITYIVSAYDRPSSLLCCLASIDCQTEPAQMVIVTDNAKKGTCAQRFNEEISRQLGAMYLNTEAPCCYHSAEIGAQHAQGDWLCFPSDDSYYCPTFAEEMLRAAKERDLQLVYPEMLHSFRGSKYGILGVEARLNRIDKTGFIIKRDLFPGFPDKTGFDCPADGLLIERLIREGIRHGKVENCLVVHS